MSAGEDFRAAFLAEFDDPGLLYATLLDAVCDALDTIEALESDVERDGRTVAGSRGQPIVNPAIPELRQQRAALAKLLAELELDTDATRARASAAGRALQSRKR
jgi:hypothetical protein